MKQTSYDWQECYLNLVMKELANVGKVVCYTPKCHPDVMVTYLDEEYEKIYEYYLETREFSKFPAGEVMHLNRNAFLIKVNGIYYFMNLVTPEFRIF